jgi:hypothetical protein
MLVVSPVPARMEATAYKNSEQVTLLCSKLPRIIFADVNGIIEWCRGRLSYAVLKTGMSDVCFPPSNGDRPGQPRKTGLVSLVCQRQLISCSQCYLIVPSVLAGTRQLLRVIRRIR